MPERRGHRIGDKLRAELERWAAEHGATELEGPVAEEDAGSLAWAAARGYEEAGRNSRMVLDLTTIEAPAVEPPPGIEIVTWAERPELAEGLWEVAREAAPDIPGEEETDVGTLDEWLERDMRGSGDRPEAVFVARRGRRGPRLRQARLLGRDDRARVPRPHRRQARPPRPRDRGGPEGGADRLGEGERLPRSLQTSNEVRNAPIRHLNAKHGYVLEPGVVIVRRTLAAT